MSIISSKSDYTEEGQGTHKAQGGRGIHVMVYQKKLSRQRGGSKRAWKRSPAGPGMTQALNKKAFITQQTALARSTAQQNRLQKKKEAADHAGIETLWLH